MKFKVNCNIKKKYWKILHYKNLAEITWKSSKLCVFHCNHDTDFFSLKKYNFLIYPPSPKHLHIAVPYNAKVTCNIFGLQRPGFPFHFSPFH